MPTLTEKNSNYLTSNEFLNHNAYPIGRLQISTGEESTIYTTERFKKGGNLEDITTEGNLHGLGQGDSGTFILSEERKRIVFGKARAKTEK